MIGTSVVKELMSNWAGIYRDCFWVIIFDFEHVLMYKTFHIPEYTPEF